MARPRHEIDNEDLIDHRSEAEIEVERQTGFRLTVRQKRFCEIYVEGETTAAGAAIRAGYTPHNASKNAYIMLDPRRTPAVSAYLKFLREEREAKYGVTREGMLQRLYTLSRGAEAAKQFSAAINAEKIRASLAGLTIDRRETVNTINDMTKDQVVKRLEELRRKHPAAFAVIDAEYEEIYDDAGTGSKLLELSAEEPSEGDTPD